MRGTCRSVRSCCELQLLLALPVMAQLFRLYKAIAFNFYHVLSFYSHFIHVHYSSSQFGRCAQKRFRAAICMVQLALVCMKEMDDSPPEAPSHMMGR